MATAIPGRASQPWTDLRDRLGRQTTTTLPAPHQHSDLTGTFGPVRFVFGTLMGILCLTLQTGLYMAAVLAFILGPFLLLLFAFPLILLVSLFIVAGGAVLTAFGLV